MSLLIILTVTVPANPNMSQVDSCKEYIEPKSVVEEFL